MQTAKQYKRFVITKMFRRAALRRAKCVAFGLGNTKRLGDKSMVRSLDDGIVDMIMRFYAKPSM